MDLRVRVALRVEHGRRGTRDDLERLLFDADALLPPHWIDTRPAPPGTFAYEHGHILADLDHVLLEDQVHVADCIEWTSALRLEGHPLASFAEPLLRGGRVGRALHEGTNRLGKQFHEVVDIFEDPATRRRFAEAIRDPQRLTSRMQRSLLFLVLLSSVWVWVVGLIGFALIVPALSVAWNLAFTLFFASLGTNLFLPIPVEPLALASTGSLGIIAVVVAAAAGKTVGAWIIYTLGPVLRKGVARLEKKSKVTRRVMAAADAFARRFGYVALGAMLAVPFSPFDIIPVYLFSTLDLKLGPFLLAVFVGFGLRLAAVLLLGEVLF